MVRLDVLCPHQKILSGHIFTILNYVLLLQEPNIGYILYIHTIVVR